MDYINSSNKKFILNVSSEICPEYYSEVFFVADNTFFNSFPDYFEQFLASKVIFSPEMMLHFVRIYCEERGLYDFDFVKTFLDEIEDVYDYEYFNQITNISYRYKVDSSEVIHYWADHAEPGERIKQPPDPKLDGYIFGGWFTDEALTQLFDFENDIPFEATAVQNTEGEESDTAQEEAEQEPFEPFMLFAKWVEQGEV